MSVQMKFFMIPLRSLQEAEEELNRFLAGIRVVQLQRELVDQGANSFWSIAFEYLLGGDSAASGLFGSGKRRGRIDYKETLSPEDFAIFAR